MTRNTERSLATVARLMNAYFEGEVAAVRYELRRTEEAGHTEGEDVLRRIVKDMEELRGAWAELAEVTEQSDA